MDKEWTMNGRRMAPMNLDQSRPWLSPARCRRWLKHRPLGQEPSPCVGPEQCSCSERSERAERSERSERVWPQIVRNIWPTLAKYQSKIGQNQPKTPKVNMLRSGDVSFDFGFEWCLGLATGYVAKISPKSVQNLSKSAQNTKSQHVEIWGCQF